MSGCHYPSPAPERERRYQHKVSLVVRYFMIPCNICLILLATSTLGFAVLLFLNNYKPSHFTPAQPPDGCRAGRMGGFLMWMLNILKHLLMLSGRVSVHVSDSVVGL
ncbi:agrin-like [Poecilia latipinna]|uniref:agrin-like n=1 Tax=Poecilia mexicana TaxID=48701 RepID=UPI00072EED32|nr:PREDICTED: agrin-like [Poecilia mexicana]XP_014879522.1 PREDICTED: agrin-like [Poecilia latipinna]